jgi:hypothetical protein
VAGEVARAMRYFIFALALSAPPLRADVVVATTSELLAAVDAANRGGDPIILLRDGTYLLNTTLVITGAGITLRGLRGVREAASVVGPGMQGSVRVLILVQGSGFTARDLTLGRVNAHAVQVQGEQNASHVVLSNLRIQDTFEQMVKISYLATSANRSRNGLLENSLLEYTAGIGPQFYIGGIDGHFCKDWVVRGNTFRNIQSPGGSLAEHAVHFWSGAEGTIVEGNRIFDCDRGIGFGLGDRGHVGGIIRNNMVWHGAQTTPFADVGIGLENASNVEVVNNTVVFANAYPNAIEYRFPGTQGGRIANNLCNQAIRARDGAGAQLQANLTNAAMAWFLAPAQGDLHLMSAVAAVVDQGVAVPTLDRDWDGQPRPLGLGVDVGADEWVALAAAHDPFGSGCGGSAGEPTVRATRLPWLGHPFELEIGNLANSRGAVLLLGTSRTSWGSTPLPLDLGPAGMPGCALRTSVGLAVALTIQNGAARWSGLLPADPALLGARFFDQALSLEPGSNPLGAVLSAGGEGRVGG